MQQELLVEARFVELDMNDLQENLAKGSVDLGLGAITVSAEREAQFDFTNSFYPSGLGIVYRADETDGLNILRNMLSANFVKVVSLLCAVLFVVGLLVWLVERRKNEDFEKGPHGLLSGFWWSAVTMTTVGYGDKAPRTFTGKILALVWMFASLIMISYFTASIASALTISGMDSKIAGPADLQKVRVGIIEGTISENYLKANHVAFVSYSQVNELFTAIQNHEIDAAVADYPILKYHLHQNPMAGIKMLPHKVNEFFYAIPLRNNLPQAETIKRVVQAYIETGEWKNELNSYFGNLD